MMGCYDVNRKYAFMIAKSIKNTLLFSIIGLLMVSSAFANCIDNTTYSFNATVNNQTIELTKPCDNGCDVLNGVCYENLQNQTVFGIGIFSGLSFLLLIFGYMALKIEGIKRFIGILLMIFSVIIYIGLGYISILGDLFIVFPLVYFFGGLLLLFRN